MPQNTSVATITPEMRDMSTTTIKTLIASVLGTEMVPVAACESGFRQYDDTGRVLRSKTFDVGALQLNVDVWGLKAKALGFNIYSPIGNIEMAKYILDTAGINSWTCEKLVAEK